MSTANLRPALQAKHFLSPPLWTPAFSLLCTAVLAFFLGYHLLIPIFPLLLEQKHLSAGETASILAVFTIASLAIRPFAGYWTDRYSSQKLLLAAIALFTAANALVLVLPVNTWLILRALQGFGFGVMYTSSSRWLIQLVPQHRKAEGIGIFSNAMKLAMAIAPAFGLWLYRHPWVASFNATVCIAVTIGFGIIGLLAVFGVARFLPVSFTTQSPQSLAPFTLRGLIHRNASISGALMATSSLVYGVLIPFVPMLAVALHVEDPGWFYTVYAVSLMASRSMSGPWADRWGRLTVALPGMAMVGLSVLWFQHAHQQWAFLLATALYGLAAGTVQPSLMADASDRAEPERQGAALATFSMWNDAGIALGTFWMGWAGPTWGYLAALSAVAGVVFAGVFAGIALAKQTRTLETLAGDTSHAN